MIFLHNYLYALKGIIREKASVIWGCIFPFVLGTLFVAAFSGIYEKDERFQRIPAAVVLQEENQTFLNIVKGLENEEGKKLFLISRLSREEAEQKLEKEEIDGYYLVDEDISLVIRENGVNQTILHVFLEQYNQQAAMIQEVAQKNPQNVQKLMELLSEETEFYTEVNQSKGNMDAMTQYYYALIAMSCLFGSYLSFGRFSKLHANISVIGARRGIAPIRKMWVVFSEFAACWTIGYVIQCLLVAYLVLLCHINLGSRIEYVFPVALVGSAMGCAIGALLGSVGRMSENVRVSLITGVTLGMSFFSGLMACGIKQLVEDYAPFFNRINPAVLITDALYSVNVFETLDRYWMNLGILSVMTLALCIVSILVTRRVRYASL